MRFRLTAASVLAVLLAGGAAAQQQEPTSGRDFVDEAAKAAERAQQRDKELVREMSDLVRELRGITYSGSGLGRGGIVAGFVRLQDLFDLLFAVVDRVYI